MKRCAACQSAYPSHYTHCPRDGTALADASDWSKGTLVRGKYRILTKVGQGGMGAVYKAVHTRFNEVRALKVISPELASDANFVRRFEQEAIVTRKLQHPNSVHIEDIDEAEDGRPFIVMEYIEGRNLKDVIEQEAPMAVERVCSIIKKAASALDAAHALGLVHRDIKPGNIALIQSSDASGMMSEQVKVFDFGIAKLKEAHLEESKGTHLRHLTLTNTGVVIGTPAYMSPEQARGIKGDQLDGRSDLYSLGIVMYQMLTGELPLKAESNIEQLMAHINIQPKPIHEVRVDVPEHVAAAVMRCLEKERDARPTSGKTLIDTLDAALAAAEDIVSRPSSNAPRVTTRPLAPRDLGEESSKSLSAVATGSRNLLWMTVGLLILALASGAWYLGKRLSTSHQGPVSTVMKVSENPVSEVSGANVNLWANGLGEHTASPTTAPRMPAKPGLPTPSVQGSDSASKTEVVGDSKSDASVPARRLEPPAVAVVNWCEINPKGGPNDPAVLVVRSNPAVDSRVLWEAEVDGQSTGSISHDGCLVILGLPPGQHRLGLDVPSYRHYEGSVNLVPGRNTTAVNLVAEQALLSATPASAATASISILAPNGNAGKAPEDNPGGPSAPKESRNTAVAAIADGENSASPFNDVMYWYGIAHRTSGRLIVSTSGIVFSDYDGKWSFKVACSEVLKVDAYRSLWVGPKLGYFHVKTRSKNYEFALYLYVPHAKVDEGLKQKRDDIINAVEKDCKVR